ncbi:MAG: type II toxin-antitoxin system HipA family toxin [Boseongicola sp. SB0677_bin_26]|nr:type II toxin-antitoxin system HipA family toxin [Boseongicola sp. SB0665_bin_10]MYG25039.1 type II toxin-antitoxin system HipA family toxin [Boseongicola sp. SB0677_bin_26]
MAETLEVHVQVGKVTHRVGTLYCHVRGGSESSTFVYGPGWLKNPKAFAIQPDMPLARDGYHVSAENGSLPGAVRDGSPDRWGRKLIIRAMQRRKEQEPLSEAGFLVSLDDSSRIGALRYRFEAGDEFLRKSAARSVPPIMNIARLLNASDAVQEDTATAEDLRFLLGYGSPLGGARPKSAVLDSDGAIAIAKFPATDDIRNVAAGEVLAAELAVRAGITASRTRLLRIEDRPVSLVRRFDRDAECSRTHFISAMTMTGAREGDDGTYTDIALAVRQFCAEPTRDAHELFRRAAFNVLATNLDDHLRNHAFLFDHVSGKWRLSPAYDMNPVPVTERPRHLTTWISEAGDEAALDNLLEVCRDFCLEPDMAREIVCDVADAIRQWREVGRGLGLSESDIAPYETAFEHRELEAALAMSRPVTNHGQRFPESELPAP